MGKRPAAPRLRTGLLARTADAVAGNALPVRAMSSRPLVLLPACNPASAYPSHTVARPYVDAVEWAGCRPVIVPRASADEVDDWLSLVDGVVLTGSPSNVHPSHFGEAVHDPSLPLDPLRDAWTLPLARRALATGVPLLAICRGAQEVNVALGGSLHQAVHEVAGFDDHRSRDDDPLERQWADVHTVTLEPGGRLQALLGAPRIEVNSLHGQAVARLAEGLQVEARAPDGLIEAFCMPAAPGFNLAVQWHPEWQAERNPWSRRLFEAFAAAARTRANRPRT